MTPLKLGSCVRPGTSDSISGENSKLEGQGTDIAVSRAAINRQGADHEHSQAGSHRISTRGSIYSPLGHGRQPAAHLHGSEN